MVQQSLVSGVVGAALQQQQQQRAYGSGSFWDVGGQAQARQELCFELHAIRTMLPERHFAFSPTFHPHGVHMMPDRLAPMPPLAMAEAEAAAAAVDWAAHGDDEGMLADSVKRKRKLKMRKHKYKKRMRKMRHQL